MEMTENMYFDQFSNLTNKPQILHQLFFMLFPLAELHFDANKMLKKFMKKECDITYRVAVCMYMCMNLYKNNVQSHKKNT